MRRTATPAEQMLWRRLRRDQLGVRFRRQAVIGRFIVDFYCPDRALAVELDGAVHDGREDEDAERKRMLGADGVRVLRVRDCGGRCGVWTRSCDASPKLSPADRLTLPPPCQATEDWFHRSHHVRSIAPGGIEPTVCDEFSARRPVHRA